MKSVSSSVRTSSPHLPTTAPPATTATPAASETPTQSPGSANTASDTASPPLRDLGQASVEMHNLIQKALADPNAAHALAVLADTCCQKFSGRPDQLAFVAPQVLEAFAQRGREAPRPCLLHLQGFLERLTTAGAIEATTIPPPLLARLIDDLILQVVKDIHPYPHATLACTNLLKAKHDDIEPLYRLASILVNLPAERKMGWLHEHCIDLIKAIPHSQTQVLFAERLLANVKPWPDLNLLIGPAMALAGILITHGRNDLAGMHLGKQLLRETASDALTTLSVQPIRDLAALFQHPAIADPDKRRAAAQVAAAVALGVVDPDLRDELLLCAAPFMTPAEKTQSANLLWKIGKFPMTPFTCAGEPVRHMSTMAQIVAGASDDECLSMQARLRTECARHLQFDEPNLQTALLLAELIRLDPAGGRRYLADLLVSAQTIHKGWRNHDCNLIALATFQADPEGTAYVPGSEVVDKEKNPLSDSYIDRGITYVYPAWLAPRRAELLAFSLSSSSRATAQIYEGIPRNLLPLAQLSQQYTGISIQPADWPALMEHLQKAVH